MSVKVEEVNEGKIVDFMLDKCSSKKVYYVHNLTFEIFVFINDLVKKKVKFKIISADKTVYSANLVYKGKKIELRCSLRLTMLSLSRLAKLNGKKDKGIFPYEILTEDMKDQELVNKKQFKDEKTFNIFVKQYGIKINVYEVLKEYCINDVLITKDAIIKFWDIIDKMGLKYKKRILTAAKLSIENYFNTYSKILRIIDIKIDRSLRQGYFGGRVEVFGNPREDEILLHYDWSGMYSQCMREKVLGGKIYSSNIINSLEEPGFYWIKFKQELYYPILPIKRDKLLFMNGIFEGWYWFEEIKLAREYGVEILETKKVISSQYYDYFLKDFVEKNENIRKLSPLHKQIGKNNNNTFYGRLGMDPQKLSEEILNSNDIYNKNYEKIIEINGIYLGYKRKEKSTSNITIAASITSKARIKLYKGLMEVLKVEGRPCYVDTDSIIAAFKKKKYKKILNKQLGEVMFDKTKNDTIIIEGVFSKPKTYALKYLNNEEITKIKGFKVVPKFEEFKNKFYERKEIITINEIWEKRELNICRQKITKKTKLDDLTKRKWSEDLKETTPLSEIYPNNKL